MNPLHEELTAYVDGELSPERQAQVEAALATDPALRAQEQQLRRMIAAVEALPAPQIDASPAMRRAVLNAIGEPTWREKWLTWPRLVPAGLALAAAATLVVVTKPTDEAGSLDEEKLLLAQHFEVVEDLDLVDLGSSDDVEVVAALHELEAMP